MKNQKFRWIWCNPFAGVFLLWVFFFLSFAWFRMDGEVTVSYLSAMGMAGGTVYWWAKRKERIRRVPKEKQKALLYMLAAVVYAGIMMYVFFHVQSNPAIHSRNEMVPFFFLTGAWMGYCIGVTVRKKWCERRILFAIIVFSSILQLFFTMVAKFNLTQCDMGNFFTTGDGHAGYIEYLYNNHLIPAQFDPREKWQYYHPPLNHIIQAVLLKMQTLCGVDLKVAVKNVQYPTMLYTMLSTVCAYKIFRELKLRKLPLVLATAVMAFTPAFRYVGILINNDMLSVLFVLLCILFTIRWYRNPTVKNILKIAVCFGLGALSKLSAVLIAPPIAVVFIDVLIRRLRNREYQAFGGLMGQMGAFLAVAAPLSLYWSLRNYFRFGVPLGYVPLSHVDEQYIPQPALQRIFDFNFEMFRNPYLNHLEYYNDFNDYNPLVTFIKSSATEYGTIRFILGEWAGHVCFWPTLVLALVSFGLMVYVLVKKNSMPVIGKVFWGLTYLVYLVSYEHFCIQYPYVCTEHVRYALPLIVTGAFFIGKGIEQLSRRKSRLSRVLTYGTGGTVLVFSLGCIVVSIAYGVIFTIGMMWV